MISAETLPCARSFQHTLAARLPRCWFCVKFVVSDDDLVVVDDQDCPTMVPPFAMELKEKK